MDLAAYLAEEKLTLAAFGQLVGIKHKQTMQRYVQGTRVPPLRVIQAIERETKQKVTLQDIIARCDPEQASA